MSRRIRRVASALALATLVGAPVASTSQATATSPAAEAAADDAVAFLASQQDADGSWESSFSTFDATLAVAMAGQADDTWSEAEALAAVEAVTNDGNSPVDALDDQADAGVSAGKAAQLVLLADALGLDPHDFDPRDDSPAPVDLVATLDAGAPTYGGIFSAPLALFANVALGRSAPAATVEFVRDEQLASGAWGFGAGDVDTTGVAVAALAAGGASPGDEAVRRGLEYLTTQHAADGSFLAFGAGSPNSTALAMIGLTAAGFDPANACWRDYGDPSLVGTSYTSPEDWLLSVQEADGRISDDSFSPVFATAQAVQGLLRRYLPVFRTSSVVGTAAGEHLDGTAGPDVVCALGGVDIVDGGGGDDLLLGGADIDVLSYGSAPSGVVVDLAEGTATGGGGDDVVRGFEWVLGSAASDVLVGDAANELLAGGGGPDLLVGAGGADLISGGAGSDLVVGGPGADWLFGNAGDDALFGQAGDDRLEGQAGVDALNGGADVDTCRPGPPGTGESQIACEG